MRRAHRPPCAPRRTLWPALLVCAAALAFSGCKRADADASASAAAAPQGQPGAGHGGGPPGAGGERPPTAVRVVTAERRPLERALEFTGDVVATDIVALSPETSGRLVRLGVDAGDRVRAGEVIAELDDAPIRDRRAETQARIETAAARLARAEAELAQQRAEIARREPLVAQDAFPAAELARMRDAVQVAEQAVGVARAERDEAEAALGALRTQIAQTRIAAPFDALVVERHVAPGAIVSPQSPIVTLVDEASLRFVFRLPESRIAGASPGARATVRLDAWPDRELVGIVRYVGSVIDRDSRTVEVRLEVEAEQDTLRHGMFGRGRLGVERVEDAVVVLPSCVQSTDDGARVWIVTDGTATPVPVRELLRTEREVALTGLSGGESVVAAPPMGLTEGARVHVVGSAPAPAPAEGSGG